MPDKCPICLNIYSEKAKIVEVDWDYGVNCPVCGRYKITEPAYSDILDPQTGRGQKLSSVRRAAISHMLRSRKDGDSSSIPKLTSDILNNFLDANRLGPSPAEQATKIIKYVGDDVSHTGKVVDRFPVGFYAIIGAPNPEFSERLAKELIEQGILSGIDASTMDGTEHLDINLTLKGWGLYEAEIRGEIAGNHGFLALKFDDGTLEPFVKNVIKPAIKEGIGYDLLDMRDVARAGIIDNIMRAQIRDAAFVIVDLTHDNSGAYWEAGYAEGLGSGPINFLA